MIDIVLMLVAIGFMTNMIFFIITYISNKKISNYLRSYISLEYHIDELENKENDIIRIKLPKEMRGMSWEEMLAYKTLIKKMPNLSGVIIKDK